MKLLSAFISYIKKPEYEVYRASTTFKKKVAIGILGWMLLFSIAAGMLVGMVQTISGMDLGEHSINTFIDEYSIGYILLFAVVVAPLFEEFIFRGPLIFFKQKSYFKWVFYGSVVAFAAIHLWNYENGWEQLLWAPLLILPQLISGAMLGFIRVRMGLHWSILVHAAFNAILVTPFLLIKLLNLM